MRRSKGSCSAESKVQGHAGEVEVGMYCTCSRSVSVRYSTAQYGTLRWTIVRGVEQCDGMGWDVMYSPVSSPRSLQWRLMMNEDEEC